MRKLLLLMMIFLVACSSPETIIKPRVVAISVPEIKDSIPAVFLDIPEIKLDTLQDIFEQLPDSARFDGVKEIITANGDKLKVKVTYFPKQNSFAIDIPSYSIDTIIIDTTKIIDNKKSWFDKIEYYIYGTIIIIVLSLIIGILRRIYG